MKGLSTEQNVHKSMNIVHDLATLGSVEVFRVTTKHFNFCEIALWDIIETAT